ncbi:MAG: hypothetical protein ACRCWQ_11200 [Bacilli bacterium]
MVIQKYRTIIIIMLLLLVGFAIWSWYTLSSVPAKKVSTDAVAVGAKMHPTTQLIKKAEAEELVRKELSVENPQSIRLQLTRQDDGWYYIAKVRETKMLETIWTIDAITGKVQNTMKHYIPVTR